jgi:hypothetical protein
MGWNVPSSSAALINDINQNQLAGLTEEVSCSLVNTFGEFKNQKHALE